MHLFILFVCVRLLISFTVLHHLVILLGEFADVYKGKLQTPKGNGIVAVKVLRVSKCLGHR